MTVKTLRSGQTENGVMHALMGKAHIAKRFGSTFFGFLTAVRPGAPKANLFRAALT